MWTFPVTSRPGPEPPWLFVRVNSLLGGKGSHSDMDVVLEVSLVKDPAKPWMEDDDGVSLASTLSSMLVGSVPGQVDQHWGEGMPAQQGSS